MILEGKDGVGKSVIAAMLAQYRDSNGHQTQCIDTDPVDTTFHGYAALAVHQIALMEKDEIIPRRFDARVEMVAPPRHDILIDNGASTLMPPTRYLVTGGGPAVLAGMGHELVIRSVVTGGDALLDTVTGLPACRAVSGRTSIRGAALPVLACDPT